MSTRSRRHWTADEKWRIIEEARQTELSVSEVCRRRAGPTRSEAGPRWSAGNQ